MPNITLSFNDDLLRKRCKYANSLTRELISRELEQENTDWLEQFFTLMDKANANSKGWKWNR